MKIIIAGSRQLSAYKDFTRVWWVADAVLKSGLEVTEVVSGGCRGIDLAGELYAESHNPPIPIKRFLPDWNGLGKAAGPIRNAQMADYAEGLILIWDGKSRGSASMLQLAIDRKLKIHQYIIS